MVKKSSKTRWRQVAAEEARKPGVRAEAIGQRVDAQRIEPTNPFVDRALQFLEGAIPVAECEQHPGDAVGVHVFLAPAGQQFLEDRTPLPFASEFDEADAFERADPGKSLRNDGPDAVLLQGVFGMT